MVFEILDCNNDGSVYIWPLCLELNKQDHSDSQLTALKHGSLNLKCCDGGFNLSSSDPEFFNKIKERFAIVDEINKQKQQSTP